ncbi:MAG: nitroreductase [Tissierellia bacterium]|nr:nitroreductase [Tissierellia bacterium]
MSIINSLNKRRSYYNIKKSSPISDEEIIKLVQDVVAGVPDAYNMQSAKVVLALGKKQDELWDAIYDVFDGQVKREKIDSFKAGYGTILYFLDKDIVKGMQDQFPLYAENFDIWSNQANGMLQHSMWVALREKELGASLQHYNPVIDDAVKKMFNVPASWKLIAQMPFGEIVEEPGEKELHPIDERVKIFK